MPIRRAPAQNVYRESTVPLESSSSLCITKVDDNIKLAPVITSVTMNAHLYKVFTYCSSIVRKTDEARLRSSVHKYIFGMEKNFVIIPKPRLAGMAMVAAMMRI